MRSVFWKLVTGLIIIAILVPLGIVVPRLFNAGGAWGEWETQELEKLVGYLPAGLAKTAHLWRAPVPGYGLGPEATSTLAQSARYILSSLIGAGIAICVMYALSRILMKKK